MKKFFSLLLIIGALVVVGCGDDAAGPTGAGGGLGGGGNGGGSVTFTSSLVQDNQQNYFFELKPSTAVVVNSVTVNCAAANVNNAQVQGDGTTVFSSTEPVYISVQDPNILAQGQQWSFTIAGKIGSSTGTAYSASTNCPIQ